MPCLSVQCLCVFATTWSPYVSTSHSAGGFVINCAAHLFHTNRVDNGTNVEPKRERESARARRGEHARGVRRFSLSAKCLDGIFCGLFTSSTHVYNDVCDQKHTHTHTHVHWFSSWRNCLIVCGLICGAPNVCVCVLFRPKMRRR